MTNETTRNEFTFEDAVTIQRENIDGWYLVLKPEIFIALVAEQARQNAQPNTDPYKVWRGQAIDEWVLNYINDARNARVRASNALTEQEEPQDNEPYAITCYDCGKTFDSENPPSQEPQICNDCR